MKINVSYVRLQKQFGLHNDDFIQAMCHGIEDLDVARIRSSKQDPRKRKKSLPQLTIREYD